MIRWKFWMSLSLLAAVAGLGCHKSSGITLTIAPSTTSVLINNSVQFVPTVTGSSASVDWEVNSVAGGTPSTACGVNSTPVNSVTCYGTINSSGLYIAPAVVPANPVVTITGTVSGTSTVATATVTIVSGVQVSVNNAITTIGTGETYGFSALITGVPTGATGSAVTINGTNYGACSTSNPNPSASPPVLSCNAVVWSVNAAGGATCTTAGQTGCINALTGVYTAPNSSANGTAILVTATSVFDTNATGTALVTLVQATDPTLVSVGPNTGARGAVFQDVYLSGTNFISTTDVFINGVQVPPSFITVSSVTCSAISTTNTSGTSTPTPPCVAASLTNGATVMRVRIPDYFLSGSQFNLPSTNSVSLTFTVSRQTGSPIGCTLNGSPNPTACQLTLAPVRPAIVGVTPDSTTASVGSFSFTVDGGYYGTVGNPAGTGSTPVVSVQFNGQSVPFTVAPENLMTGAITNFTDRQITANLQSGVGTTPGLFEVGVSSLTSGLPPAISNLAVQPNYASSTPSILATLPVGSMPSAVAINTATGIAVVANQKSNDVTLINLAGDSVVASICTGGVGQTEPCPGQATSTLPNTVAPTGVAVDNINNLALVTNSAQGTLAVINLATQQLTATINLTAVLNAADNQNPVNVSTTPIAVGINPVIGRALVAFRGANFALILNESTLTSCAAPQYQCIAGISAITTGTNPRIAVSPNLNWALVTPGGLGTLSIVNLSQQSSNVIAPACSSSCTTAGLSRTAGTVTVTTTSTTSLQVGEPILIEGAMAQNGNPDTSFDGLYTVASVPTSTTFTYTQLSTLPNVSTSGSGTVLYGIAVAAIAENNTITGVAINDITSKAVLTDPAGNGDQATIFNMLDQTTSSPLTTGTTIPQEGMIGAAFNPLDNIAVTVNQTNSTAYVITPGQPGQSPIPPAVATTFSTGSGPWDVAIDPGTDTAVVINQNDNTATIANLTTIRPLQILEVLASCGSNYVGPGVAFSPCGGNPSNPNTPVGPNQIYVPGTLAGGPAPNNVYLTIIGKGFSSGSPAVRVDGTPLSSITVVSDRVIEATLPAAMQMAPHHYAVDVSVSPNISNSLPLSVIEAVSVSASGCASAPSPIGVAIDAPNNIAVVSDINCNVAYLINLATSSGRSTPAVAVGTAPLGVAVVPQGGLALVANSGSNSISFVNDLTGTIVSGTNFSGTISTEAFPFGVAIDPVLGQAVVTANGANDIDTFSIDINANSPSGTAAETYTATAVGEGPVAVAVDPVDHIAAVVNETGSSVSLIPLVSSNFTAQTVSVPLPTGVAYDPVNDDFLIVSSLSNTMSIVNPLTLQVTPVSVGINPTSLAYNFASGTLVTLNTSGGNMTIVDMVSQIVRAVMPISSSSELAVDIHPQSNLVVVSDGANSRVLLVPMQ